MIGRLTTLIRLISFTTLHARLIASILVLGTSGASAQVPTDSRGLKPLEASDGISAGRKALLIGNRNYRNAPLLNPVNDATDFGQLLRRLGFEALVLTDASTADMLVAVDNFIASLGKGDIGVFFYSGHGLQIDADNYIIPVEFTAENEVQARRRAVSLNAVKARLERSPASLTVIILDSCRNNPFSPGGSTRRGLALLEAGLGSFVVFAASPGRTASDNSTERNGLFTKHLLEEASKPITVSELFRKVRQDVRRASGGSQIPYIHDQVIADYSLAGPVTPRSPAQEGTPARPANPLGIELRGEARRLYRLGQCAESVTLLDKLIRTEPANALTQNALGLAYVCMTMNVPAVERFSMAIQLKPDYATAYLNRGQVFLSTAQYEMAIQDFTWAIEQDPTIAVFYWKRGRALFGLRRYEDAERDFEHAIHFDPSDPNGYFGRGQVLYQLGSFQKAAWDFDMAIALKTDFSAAYVDRARVRDRLGNIAGAAEDRVLADHHSKRK